MTEADPPPARRRWHRGHEEIVVAALFLAGTLFLRLRLESFVSGREGQFLSARFWPGALLTIGIVLSAAYLVLAIIWSRRQGSETARPAEEERAAPGGTAGGATALGAESAPPRTAEAAEPEATSVFKPVAGVVLLAAYIYLLGPIGFAPATVLFAIAFLLLAGERRWFVLAIFPVVAVAVLIGIFTQLLVISLPRGTGIFLTLSTYLY